MSPTHLRAMASELHRAATEMEGAERLLAGVTEELRKHADVMMGVAAVRVVAQVLREQLDLGEDAARARAIAMLADEVERIKKR